MMIAFIIVVTILLGIIFYQQYRISQMEDKLFNALRKTCETLDLIKKDLTVEEILNLRKSKNK